MLKKVESSKIFVIQNYWRERDKKKEKKHKKKISSLHPFLSKTNGSLHQFLDGYYHIIISMWTRVNKCLIFNFALLDFSYRFWHLTWGSWRNEEFSPFKSCVPIFCQVYFSPLAPRAIYFLSPCETFFFAFS